MHVSCDINRNNYKLFCVALYISCSFQHVQRQLTCAAALDSCADLHRTVRSAQAVQDAMQLSAQLVRFGFVEGQGL